MHVGNISYLLHGLYRLLQLAMVTVMRRYLVFSHSSQPQKSLCLPHVGHVPTIFEASLPSVLIQIRHPVRTKSQPVVVHRVSNR